MIFQIDFNQRVDQTPENYKALLSIEGVTTREVDGGKYQSCMDIYEIDLNDFHDMECLEYQVTEKIKGHFALIVGFDHPTIYLDEV